MNIHLRTLGLAIAVLAALAACSTMPASNAMLDQARSDYRAAQDNPQARNLAPSELKLAGDSLARANDAFTRNDAPAVVDHLAYLAKQSVAIAQQTATQKAAELAVTNAGLARDRLRLAARTNEADAANRAADTALLQSQEAKRQTELAQRQTDVAQRQADASKRDASDAQVRNSQLEAQLNELNAKKTDRGMVITIGDVLFDTNKAQLKSGGLRSIDKLVGFLNQYPQRKALVEGFTDSTGSEATNEELSGRRADAVRNALLDRGVGGTRIAARGYGEAFPVAGNESSGGRQLNRRVEIILSDDSGNIAPR